MFKRAQFIAHVCGAALLALSAISHGHAQTLVVSVHAGSATGGHVDGTGANARFSQPQDVAVDAAGNLYVTDVLAIRKITPAGEVTTLAGHLTERGSADGTGDGARFDSLRGIALGLDGTLYVTELGNSTIRVVSAEGDVTTLAGSAGLLGTDNGTGSAARFNLPSDIVWDGADNLYVTDWLNHTIRKISLDGVVTTFAGVPGVGTSADTSSGDPAGFILPFVLAFGPGQTLTVSQSFGALRRISPTRVISTATELASLGSVQGIVFDPLGNGYVTKGNTVIRFDTNYVTTTIAGTTSAGSQDGIAGEARFRGLRGIARDTAGNLFVADAGNDTIRQISTDGTVTTLAGTPPGYIDATGSEARFNRPGGIAGDAAGNIYVSDTENGAVRKISPLGVVTTLASGISRLGDLVVGPGDDVFVISGSAIMKIAPAGNLSVFAGSPSLSGTINATGTAARFGTLQGLGIDAAGMIYAADSNSTVRRVTPAAVVSTWAGEADNYSVVNGELSTARFAGVLDIAVAATGTVYILDAGGRIRTVSASGMVDTLAGGADSSVDGIGTAAGFRLSHRIAVGGDDCIYVTELTKVRRVTPAGAVTTIWHYPAGSLRAGIAVSADNTVHFGNQSEHTILRGTLGYSFSEQPQNASVLPGAAVHFAATPEIDGTVTYQWQRSIDGGATWADLSNSAAFSGVTTTGLDVLAPTLAMDGHRFRLIVTGDGASGTSAAAILRVTDSLVRALAIGDRREGALGDGYEGFAVSPEIVAGDVVQIATGLEHSVFLHADGTLWGTGAGDLGQLGPTHQNFSPQLIATAVAAVGAGFQHTLYIKNDGTLWGLGRNYDGDLGVGQGTSQHSPVLIASNVAAADGGERFNAFLKTDGTLWTMGDNASGQLGDGTTTGRSTPLQVASNVVSFAAGANHLVFLKADATLWAAGANGSGQLGDGTTVERSTPVHVASAVTAVDAGHSSTFYIKSDGTLWAMGSNRYGQLGNGTMGSDDPNPSPVSIATDVSKVAGGHFHTLFVKSDGSCWGMGYNAEGQLGDGTRTNRPSPVFIMSGVAAVAATGQHSLFRTTAGVLLACGQNAEGQLGNGATNYQASPAQIMAEAAQVAAGGNHVLFLRQDGSLFAAGNNQFGQLGTGESGPFASANSPELVATSVVAASAGYFHSLFVKEDQTLWGAGSNFWGELGSTTLPEPAVPIQIASNVVAADAGTEHTLFLKDDGSLWGLGSGAAGQLGATAAATQSTAVLISPEVATFSAGFKHTLFVKTDGTLWACGDNSSGQLGDGSTDARTTPVLIATGVTRASAGASHSAFVKADGTLWAMGANGYSQLGDDTVTPRLLPVQVASEATMVDAGAEHTLFRKTDGTLWGMGINTHGFLGPEIGASFRTPVEIARGVTSFAAAIRRSYFVQTVRLPEVVTQPATQSVAEGNSVTLAVVATSSVAMNYQWYRGSAGDIFQPISGATASTYLTPAVTAEVSYWVRVGNLLGTIDSVTAVLEPVGPPVITANPQPVTIAAGATAQLEVTASSEASVSYQWYRGSSGDLTQPVAGAVAATFTTPVLTEDTSFWVRATNLAGYDDSATVLVNTVSPPVIQTNPASQSIVSGQSATVMVIATSEAAATYEWFLGSSGDTSRSLGLGTSSYTVLGATNHLSLWVRTTNFAGSTDSATAMISVVGPIISDVSPNDVHRAGDTITLSVSGSASDGSPPTYQWYEDGAAIAGATGSSYTLPSAQPYHRGIYSVSVSALGTTVTVSLGMVEINQAPANPGRLLNLSTRGLAQTGDNVLIPGFVIQGTGTKKLLLRAMGPTLGMAPFHLAGTLPDPRMVLKRWNPLLSPNGGYESVATNEDWGDNANASLIAQTAADVFAFSFQDPRESALLVDLAPGQYSVVADGGLSGSGLAVVELYDADGDQAAARLVNISNRGFAGVGDQVMIPGFVISAEGPKTVLLRVVGPGLNQFGVSGTMSDPQLTVYSGSTPILENDNWNEHPDPAATQQLAQNLFAFPLANGSKDAAMVATLAPGSYTVIGSIASGGSPGVVLVEVYVAP